MSHEKKEIAARLREVRGSLGVGEFAQEIGVNRKTVTRWENGDAVPDGDSLLALQRVFSVDAVWLLLGEQAASETRENAASYVIRDVVERAARGEPSVPGFPQVLRDIADADRRKAERAESMALVNNYLSALDDEEYQAALKMLMCYGRLRADDRLAVNRMVDGLAAARR